ncbi:MAG: radical SAM mobile pair protein B [Prevotella sp.]|jgi:radical SAM mobile pair protein B|nr:radical SAM mobile pair protein B [Muribaculaceae bacterium]MBQ5495568.1 radical SAM mobile pair protein B [Prevotella sp.]MBR5170636.1 radical SAM mobile pair protein B [Muribaculaceae bacterium]
MVKIQEIEVKSVMTKSNLPVADFSVNPYVGCLHGCKYCYASFMKRFTNHPEPWGEFIDVKHWPEIKNAKRYAGKEAFFGSVTDCYQPHEAKYKRTRALLEQLQGSGISVSIATKSDLVLRDLDLIKTFPHARVSWSINTLDESFRREMDVAVSIERRLEAMRQFYEAGVETTCFISPIFPGITDVEAIIERAKGQCNLVWLENLNLRGDYRPVILDWIHAHHPELDSLYHEIYSKRDRSYWVALDQQLREYTARQGMTYVRDDDTKRSDFGQPPVVANYFYHEEVKKSAKAKS